MKDNLQTSKPFRMTKSGPQKVCKGQKTQPIIHITIKTQMRTAESIEKKNMFEPRGLLELERDLNHKVSVLKKTTINELQKLFWVEMRSGKGT